MFLETSALTGENVEEAFVQCARKILNKIESGRFPVSEPRLDPVRALLTGSADLQGNWIQRGWDRGSSTATPPYASSAPPAGLNPRAPRSVAASGPGQEPLQNSSALKGSALTPLLFSDRFFGFLAVVVAAEPEQASPGGAAAPVHFLLHY